MKSTSLKIAVILALLISGIILAYDISQQLPYGAVKGRVTAQENGNALQGTVYITQRLINGAQYNAQTKEDGTFKLSRIPIGVYSMTFSSAAHSVKKIKVIVEEGKTKFVEVEASPDAPRMEMFVHQHVFTPGEKPQITCNGFVESNELSVKIYRIDPDAFLYKNGKNLRTLIGAQSYYDKNSDKYITKAALDNNPDAKLDHAFVERINTKDSEGVFTQRVTLPALKTGLYVISTMAGDIQGLDWIQVTTIGLVSKSTGKQFLTYTVDLKTGKPLNGVDVSVYSDTNLIAHSKTSADGLVSDNTGISNLGRTIIARIGDAFAFTNTWGSEYDSGDTVIYAYTDRPVYRPSQKVYFKGIVRKFADDKYQVLDNKPVELEVRDSKGTLIYKVTKNTNSFGSIFGSFMLNSETATGYYIIQASVSGQKPVDAVSFNVMSYKKPEYKVSIETSRKRYTKGQIIRAKISSAYYFGAPVADATVYYSISRSPYWFFQGDEDFAGDYEDYGGYGEFVTDGTVKTDKNGEVVIEFAADWPKPDKINPWDNDQMFSIEVNVSDKSDRSVSESKSVIATRGGFALNVRPDKYVAEPGSEVKVYIEAKDYRNNPVRNKEIELSIGKEKWADDGESSLIKIKDLKLTTDKDGNANASFTAGKSGDISIIAKTRDVLGNEITQRSSVWVYSLAGYEESDEYSYTDLAVITDKKTYNVGDTVKAVINTKSKGNYALITVEGQKIYSKFITKLKSKSTMIEIPVKDNYKPNFYIGVCYVNKKKFVSAEAKAKVSLKLNNINVKITPDKNKYKPRDIASYKIKTTDTNGKGIRAEVSLGVVDDAIYAIMPDTTTPILDYFYSKKPNSVQTSFSFPEIYLSSNEKAEMKQAGKPGSDYKGLIRKRFEDTAFWMPDVVTNSNGDALIRFQMPDNLTTWKTTARAITLSTNCGQSLNSVIVKQDLLVRLQTPRFLVQGDKTTFSAIVHNYTSDSRTVKVELDAKGLELSGDFKQEIAIDKNDNQRIDWKIDAPKPGKYIITVYATSDKLTDAMQIALTVKPHALKRVFVKTGSISGNASEIIPLEIRNDAILSESNVSIRLAPSLASVMLGSLQYLAQYPYGCAEQTTSAFLPDIVIWQMFKELNIKDKSLQAKLPDMVTKGLFRLYRMQQSDGGWGWGGYGKSDLWMTAYVCYGLLRAKEAGFEVNMDYLNEGLNALGSLLKTSNSDVRERSYAVYVLSMAGKAYSVQLQSILNQSNSNYSLAYMALAYNRAGYTAETDQLISRLYQNAIVENGLLHWDESEKYYTSDIETNAAVLEAIIRSNPNDQRKTDIARWLMIQRQGDAWYSTRDTAMVLYAMCEFLKSTNELSPDFTANIKIKDAKFNKHIPNGPIAFTRDSIYEPDKVIKVPASSLKKGLNEITVSKIGTGNLYYTIQSDQYIYKKNLSAIISDSGITIRRKFYKTPSSGDQSSRGDLIAIPRNEVDSCKTNDLIMVRLIVYSNSKLRHLMLEDYIPAGFEIIDKGEVEQWDWDYWWIDQDVRDDRISFYLDELPKGKNVVDYYIRAGASGSYHALPAIVFEMYNPQNRASSDSSEFDIE